MKDTLGLAVENFSSRQFRKVAPSTYTAFPSTDRLIFGRALDSFLVLYSFDLCWNQKMRQNILFIYIYIYKFWEKVKSLEFWTRSGISYVRLYISGWKKGQIVIAIFMKFLVTKQLNGTIDTSLLDGGWRQKQSRKMAGGRKYFMVHRIVGAAKVFSSQNNLQGQMTGEAERFFSI